jgi:hypothetical protein
MLMRGPAEQDIEEMGSGALALEGNTGMSTSAGNWGIPLNQGVICTHIIAILREPIQLRIEPRNSNGNTISPNKE